MPQVLHLMKELTIKSYEYFKNNTDEMIEEKLEQVEKFEEDLKKQPTETEVIYIKK